MVTLNIKVRNMCVNTMGAISMVVKKCFPHSRDSHMNNKITMEERWKNTKLKEKRLKDEGYIVLSKWSCEFTNDKRLKLLEILYML